MIGMKLRFKGLNAFIHSLSVRWVICPSDVSTCLLLVFPAPGGLWVGAVHPSLLRVQEPDQLAHRQRRQDESVGENVFPPSAEESGSVL